MKILWMSWKDRTHPEAGGAEIVNEELAKRLVKDGHEVTFIVGGYKSAKSKEVINGYEIVRLGNRFSVYFKAWRYYKNKLQGWADLVIDEVNTVPFFAKFYVKEPNILLIYMLCRKIWFYQILFPLSLLGYLIEPLYLKLLSDRKVLTESSSTKMDLLKFGFKANNIHVFNVGIELEPLKGLDTVKKYSQPTLLSFGAIRPMKRTLHQIKAFELAKQQSISNLQLIVAGDPSGSYGKRVCSYIAKSPYCRDILFLGKINQTKKMELMRKSHIIIVTSVKEGWGLIVTEAASQGTPAVVYDVDGLRDSVRNNWSGCVASHNSPADLADKIEILLSNAKKYERLRRNAWRWSKEINFSKSYRQFLSTISLWR